MARSFKTSTTVAGCLILATICTALFPTISLAGPPKGGKPSYSKPANSKPQFNKPQFNKPQFNKPQFNKPQFKKPSFAKPAKKPNAKPFVKSPKIVLAKHHHGHFHLVPVVYPVVVANGIHTLYYIDNDGVTQVYGQYEATTDAFGNTNWGGLMEAQTSLTNAGYQCWIDDMQPNLDG